jgi:hypothetical protein
MNCHSERSGAKWRNLSLFKQALGKCDNRWLERSLVSFGMTLLER